MNKLLLSLMIVPIIGFSQCISGDCKNGYGVYIIQDSYMYTGEFKDGRRHGLGHYSSFEGDGWSYKGEFKDGRRHGKGTLTWFGGDTYTGDWKDSARYGMGVFKKTDGTGDLSYYIDDKRIKTLCRF